MSTVKLRRSNVPGKTPTDSQLDLGEVAINTHDGKMFFKQDADGNVEIVEVGRSDAVDNVLYVAESGDDNKSGETLGEAFATISQALSVANTGTTIFVKSGSHVVDNTSGGVDVPSFCSIVGDSLRTTTIRGAEANNDIFHVRSGSYIANVTFRDHTNGAAAVSFNPDGSAGNIVTSPYIQNCSSFGPSGVGIRIDGSVVGGLRSMVSDSFTQINAGGIGVHLLNRGYAQLVSIFTVACETGILTESGGQCSLTNSNCSFGNFGLKSTGVSDVLYTGVLKGNASEGSETIVVDGLTERPKYGDVIKFATEDFYYTVIDSTELVSGESTITLEEPLNRDFSDNVTVDFRQRSLITASSITFEFVGTGTSLSYNTPRSGAFPVQENEVIEDQTNNAGLVYYTSTDHKGDFRIGGELLINRQEGTITGTTFDRSLFAVLTPYILALED